MKTDHRKIISLSKLGWNPPACEQSGANATPATGCEKPKVQPSAKLVGLPSLDSVLHTLNCGQPGFREPENGEFVVGIWREKDHTAAALLLWADPAIDLFFDLARRQHVKPPGFYLRLAEQPQIDAQTGYPIINGAICPF